MLNKILCVILLGFFAGLAPMEAQTVPAAPAKVKGKIVAARVQGHVEVRLKTGGDSRLLKEGETIGDGTEVTTSAGAIAILVFSNGATINVAEDSTLDIDEFIQDPFAGDLKVGDMKHEEGTSTTKLSLAKGELVGKVVHLNVDQGSEFSVQTPVGAAGIRGTIFKVTFRPGKNGKVFFTVTTAEGVVVFKGSTTSISLPAGKQVVSTFDYTPPATPATGTTTEVTTSPTIAVTLTASDVPPAEAAAMVVTAVQIVNATQTVTIPATTPGGTPQVVAPISIVPPAPVQPLQGTTPGSGAPTT
jgi:hypothetical protein